ncbi:Nif3-like dinuclear metal center hexameric protein [Paenibacillus senegalensis]|uniref:Nif3-like dinuclear metal center hexameric protein n=1 Tax=Paenibacillus senegalensis TaxID=1465766 RepID=UPI00028884FB|nr:Nif3-like dinuclear metal center hexameric protein [Paenibacillus senegalensis]
MLAKGQAVIQLMEELAPKHYALPDDKIGLQLGTLDKDIRKVMVALDVDDQVVEEAIVAKADLIIAHHAIIFRPLKTIRTDLPAGRLYEKLIKNDIAVYISHTNLDVAEGGINDLMAEALQLKETRPLEESWTDPLKKLVVFVPEDHHERVLSAILDAGAGAIGEYSHCSFNLQGTGTFKPGEGTEPYIGSVGNMEKVAEVRIETVIPHSRQAQIIKAMIKAHPYEEVAYDVYPLELKGRSLGLGRVGRLPEPLSLSKLAEAVKSAFQVPAVRVVGQLDTKIKKAAVLGGSGSRYIHTAKFCGADVLITGDIDYHSAQDAVAAGLCLIDPGHNAEKIMKQAVSRHLTDALMRSGYSTEVLSSQVDTEVFRFI